jgi:succinoglycan biosynthesis transport protein ExoP
VPSEVAAEERWRSASAADIMTLPDVLQNPSIQRLTEQRALLNAEYQQKLSIYQPDYPEMVQLNARIAEADAQIKTIAENIRSSIRSQYQIVANQERSLQAQVSGLTGEVLNLRDRSYSVQHPSTRA